MGLHRFFFSYYLPCCLIFCIDFISVSRRPADFFCFLYSLPPIEAGDIRRLLYFFSSHPLKFLLKSFYHTRLFLTIYFSFKDIPLYRHLYCLLNENSFRFCALCVGRRQIYASAKRAAGYAADYAIQFAHAAAKTAAVIKLVYLFLLKVNVSSVL